MVKARTIDQDGVMVKTRTIDQGGVMVMARTRTRTERRDDKDRQIWRISSQTHNWAKFSPQGSQAREKPRGRLDLRPYYQGRSDILSLNIKVDATRSLLIPK